MKAGSQPVCGDGLGESQLALDPSQRTRERGLEAIRDTFNLWVQSGMADGMERRHKRLAELMLARIALPSDARVLDVGCGDGWMARLLSKRLPQGAFVGIDISDEMIRRARVSCSGLDNALFAPAPAEEIPWAEDYFTHVLTIESAYYWPEPRLAAREIFRVAAFGGSFHVLINFYRENGYSAGWDEETGLSMHRMSADEWASLFRETGFVDVSTDRIPDDSPISPGKTPEQLARREGLQREGALYVTGRKPSLPAGAVTMPSVAPNPFRVLR